ncbi:MAG: methyltransferase domain-containing protein [Rhizobiales bacterium]|nr:methyltransferase domain-containing protein [Hyphomicrobiales bacterium]
MPDWISYWDTHPIYVNARHRDVHVRLIGDGILSYVTSAGAKVLDYGSGEALYAERVADAVANLTLCEAGQKLRASLEARVAGNAKISVLPPERIAALPDRSFDLIVMHSVAQYLTSVEFAALLRLFRRLLRTGGQLVLGDIVRPYVSALTDAWALLRLGARNGFFVSALLGLLHTAVSGYLRLRKEGGLTRYSERTMHDALHAAGFTAQRATMNIGHNQARMTFVARAD